MAAKLWRPVRGFEDRYLVSPEGQVWSAATRRVLRAVPDGRGYLRVLLYGGSKSSARTRKVHRLVLEAFVGVRPPGGVCRHLNGNRTDNRLVNLTWGTREQNEADKRRHRTSGHKLNAAKARRIKRARGLQREVAERFGVDRSLVSLIRSGKSWVGV